MTTTQQKVLEQLTQRSATSVVDSGAVFGYAWQRNQAKGETGLMDEHTGELDPDCRDDVFEFVAYRNVQHWMPEVLEYDETLDKLFNEWWDRDLPEETGLNAADQFPAYLSSLGLEVCGIYGEGHAFTVYTYNEDNHLSSDIHYTYFTLEGEHDGVTYYGDAYLVASIHTGCDAGWGFSRPVVYAEKEELSFISGYNRVTLYAGEHYWDYAGGYEECRSEFGTVSLDEIPCVEIEEIGGECEYTHIPRNKHTVYILGGDAYYGGEKIEVH